MTFGEEGIEESKEERKVEDLIASWEDHVGVKEEQVIVLKCEGLLKQGNNSVIEFVGTDLDACIIFGPITKMVRHAG
eukprot:15329764-Ditylum_brightwellii.AAC.1